ncbi:putative DNA-binding WGR domain protein [Micromonospora pisi]|uniref:Putative DNA-binding WGR domain protein n=1 Tax=Micromonospora pisi TaxID=589240 RepID=A0A495JCW9_9ACTN|nr:DUF4132 domain-containing protein [Micromonospora pisi]RKR86860.1 putative DNA-binding WGR domain protein [Micromonospora pisi]
MAAVRSFELVAGTSAKFWEISLDGVEVTVRYGRLGTVGQTQHKSFGSAPTAAAHMDKLVAEKLKKGYAESAASDGPTPAVAAPGGSSATKRSGDGTVGELTPAARNATASAARDEAQPPVDEQTFVVPPSWYRSRHPRRGGPGVAAVRLDPSASAAAEALLSQHRDGIAIGLAHPQSEPELVAAAESFLADAPDRTPLGATVVATALYAHLDWDWRSHNPLKVLRDAWIRDHGLEFAVRALMEFPTLWCGGPEYGTDGKITIGPLRRTPARLARTYGYHPETGLAERIRAVLAGAPDHEYAAIVEILAGYREYGIQHRVVTSFLVPTRTDWVDEDCAAVAALADKTLATRLLNSVSTPEQLALLRAHVEPYTVVSSATNLNTLVEGIGPAAAEVLAEWLDQPYAEEQRRMLSILAVLPTDEAFQVLLDRADAKYTPAAILEAAGRFPVRAMRLLASSADNRTCAELLRTHVAAQPEVAQQLLPSLPVDAAQRVRRLLEQTTVVEAPVEALPRLLVDPPWSRKRTTRKPVVIGGLSCPDQPTIGWEPGERESWAAPEAVAGWLHLDKRWEQLANRQGVGELRSFDQISFFTNAPEELARPLVMAWRLPEDTWGSGSVARIIAGRFELDALSTVVDAARRAPAAAAGALLPYASPEIAKLMASWLSRLKSARSVALAWMTRHPAAASRALVPLALGPAGTARREAEQSLIALAEAGHRGKVTTAAQGYGAAAAEAIETLLATDQLEVLPARMPTLPEWAEPKVLARVLLRDGSGALPATAVRHLLTMFAISSPAAPYPGVALVREVCQPASLAEFGWSLFQRWLDAGAPSKNGWAFEALALVADDETVRRLAPLIRAWPGEGGHTRAVNGLDVLAAIGSDLALMHLNAIAQKVKFRGLRERAEEKVLAVAASLELSPEQLADRLVPDCGLDAAGSATLDYGPRRFLVGFDEQLKPYVSDQDGKRRKELPKPGANDDPELAPAAYQRFAALKKDVRTIAADQIRRLEQAMVLRRRWPVAEFRQYFLSHPLLWHIVRRLVWGRYDESGTIIGALRVAEDRTFADLNDDPLGLPDEAVVGIAHPIHLGQSLPGWAELFADYEILQPFPQLGREVFELTEAERDQPRLARFEGCRMPTGKLLGLERRGWRRSAPEDAGHQGWLLRELPDDREVVIDLDPGIAVGAIDIFPEQTLDRIWVSGTRDGYWRTEPELRFGDLDQVTISEIIRELREVTQ